MGKKSIREQFLEQKVRTDKSREEESKLEWTVQWRVWAFASWGGEIYNETIPGVRGKTEKTKDDKVKLEWTVQRPQNSAWQRNA